MEEEGGENRLEETEQRMQQQHAIKGRVGKN